MEINKIILIGNGFDLAHGLKTSYSDFILYILRKEFENIQKHIQKDSNYDSLIYQASIDQSFRQTQPSLRVFLNSDIYNLNDKEVYSTYLTLENIFAKSKGYKLNKKDSFILSIINKSIDNWVDLEILYFDTLLKTKDADIEKLNKDFEDIKDLFQKYLHTEVLPNISTLEIDLAIKEIIDCDITNDELSTAFIADTVKKDFATFKKINEKKSLLEGVYEEHSELMQFDNEKSLNSLQIIESVSNNLVNTSIELKKLQQELLQINRLKPENIFYINFNYTNTIDKYKDKHSTSIYIHGALKNQNNPIILGYGDERSDDYKLLESKSNDYLKNIKSFAYSNTSNYKNIMRVIESNPYQVVILGHSCGMSDRVLLSTLFEHKNCISIKPYYYRNEEKGTDSFQDTIMNISRSFIDKTKMRDLVVDKTETDTYSVIKADTSVLKLV